MPDIFTCTRCINPTGFFGNVLDRILHHYATVNIKGESYKLKERRNHGFVTMQK